MTRNTFTLIPVLAAMMTPAFGMHYTAATPAFPVLIMPTVTFQPANKISTCTAASNTIAVGVDVDVAGFRILCADAGRIGVWTAPVGSAVVGTLTDNAKRFLCPSGSALAGLQFVEGLINPFPLCGELVPDFQTGSVSRTVLFTVDEVVVQKLSRTAAADDPSIVSCGPLGFIQSLLAALDAAGNVKGFGGSCNTIVTAKANLEDVNVDLAVRTVFQPAAMSRNSSNTFRVDVFNLGNAALPLSNVTLEMRFDGAAWQLLPFVGTSCTDLLGHKGVVDRVVVGERCTISGALLGDKGGVTSVSFKIQPLGADTTRPASTTPQPIVGAKVGLVDDQLEGADPNASNDLAAFPVTLH